MSPAPPATGAYSRMMTGAAFGANQHPRITTTYLNQINRHGDPGPGLNLSSYVDLINGGTIGFSGGIVQPYIGFEGGVLTLTNQGAATYGDPLVGPLYGGTYQYVRVDPMSSDFERGQVVFWKDELNYTVQAAGQTSGVNNKIAGVALCNTFAGNWDFIQMGGIAMVKFTAAGNVGTMATVNPATTPAQVTSTPTITDNVIGRVVIANAVANQVSPVQLNIMQGRNY
jgi:hypothetical protein